MAISTGALFGSYRVAEAIGSGGMGEVYRARDTELGRDVAIKVLPASFSTDAMRVARFEQEAKTLASLNHSNIAHIYGLARGDHGTGIVMELVDGPTLADRIAQGPIDVDEALRIASQLADALEAAHERGVVHRDLKPANVKVKPDGTVKVLDFGIAKALDTRFLTGPGPAALTTPAMTEAGMILGTAAYMSPEQARGTTSSSNRSRPASAESYGPEDSRHATCRRATSRMSSGTTCSRRRSTSTLSSSATSMSRSFRVSARSPPSVQRPMPCRATARSFSFPEHPEGGLPAHREAWFGWTARGMPSLYPCGPTTIRWLGSRPTALGSRSWWAQRGGQTLCRRISMFSTSRPRISRS